MDVETVLRAKGTAVYYVKPDSTISEAVKLIHEKRIGAVLVMEEDAGNIWAAPLSTLWGSQNDQLNTCCCQLVPDIACQCRLLPLDCK